MKPVDVPVFYIGLWILLASFQLTKSNFSSCIEETTSLLGQEISVAFQANTSDLCQKECQRNSSCSFYTFSQDKNLTCKLFTISRGKTANSTSLSGLKFCNTRCFEDHVEYIGPDLQADIFATSAHQCQLKCQEDSACSFFTYFPSLLLCIHKGYVLRATKNTLRSLLVISGPKSCAGDCFQNLTMFGERTIAYLNASDPRSCQAECQRHPNCTSFTFSRRVYNVSCLLKRGKGSRNSLPSILLGIDPPAELISGPKFCTTACLEPSIAYLGSNLNAFNGVKSVKECESLCQDTQSCLFFTYSETLMMCTLKNSWQQRISVTNSISGKRYC